MYAIYKLNKVVGKREYTPVLKSKYPSFKKASDALEAYYEDCFNDDEMPYGGGKCYYNKFFGEVISYKFDGRELYLPKYSTEGQLSGIWRDSTIYYIDEYPCPYTKYKLSMRGGMKLIGEKSE